MNDDGLLFDTNAFIEMWETPTGLKKFADMARQPAISVVSVGELIIGSKNSARPQENMERLNKRLLHFQVLPVDAATSEYYADLSLALRRKGKPIPDNDRWIAATAVQNGLTVLTRDAHFDHIDGLPVASW